MALVKMLRDKEGSPNGYDVHCYKGGEEYDLPESLASSFIRTGDARPIAERTPESKDIGNAPENKDMGDAPDDKARRGRGRPRKNK